MNRKFISKSNFVLRKVLNSKDNLDILQDFIECFMNIKIKDIELNPYLNESSNNLPKEENFGIADVRIKKTNGEELNVGIQFIDGYYVQNKILLYYAQIHANQLKHASDRKIARTATINILDFKYFNYEDYLKKIEIKSTGFETLELYTLELPKFQINNEEEIRNKEAWVIYLKGEDKSLLKYVIKRFEKIKKLDLLLEKYWKEEKME